MAESHFGLVSFRFYVVEMDLCTIYVVEIGVEESIIVLNILEHVA